MDGGDAVDRSADERLVKELRKRPPDDALWNLTRESFVMSFRRVLHARLLDGRLGDTRTHRRAVLSTEEVRVVRADADLRNGLVNEAALDAMETFEKQIRTGCGWRADGGASLRDYATGGALFALSTVVRRWRTTVLPDPGCVLADPTDLCLLGGAAPDDPARRVADADELGHILRHVRRTDGLLYDALVDRWHTSDSWAVIAERHGTTEKTIERRLRRLRTFWNGAS